MKFHIYKITHNDSGKVYIGATSNLKRRMAQHSKNSQSKIGRAIIEHGIDAFDVEIIKTTANLFDVYYVYEPYYIGQYQSDITGYNGQINLARPYKYGQMKKAFYESIKSSGKMP